MPVSSNAVGGQFGRRLGQQRRGFGLAPGVTFGPGATRRFGQDRGGHLRQRGPGRRGQLGELTGGLGRRQAEPLHQGPPGHRDDGLGGGGGADAVKLTPLVVDDGDQPQHVVVAARHDHPPSLRHPLPRVVGGFPARRC